MPVYLNRVEGGSTDCDSRSLLRINSCGANLPGQPGEPTLSVRRSEGRKDYQLIYIWSGQARYRLEGRDRVLGDGTLILYRPGEPQEYDYRAENRCRVGWIHFTGTLAPSLLTRCGLMERPVARVGYMPEINRLLLSIIRELNRGEPLCEELAAARFLELIALIGRRLMRQGSRAGAEDRIREVQEYLRAHYAEPVTVEDMAGLCGLSRHHFTHLFTRCAGEPPYAFLTGLRLREASRLLREKELSVAEVARLCGYSDPLYFSSLFRKRFGVPPSAYRRMRDKEETP